MIRRNDLLGVNSEIEVVSIEELDAPKKRNRKVRFTTSLIALVLVSGIGFYFWPTIRAEFFTIGGGIKWVSVILIALQMHSQWHGSDGSFF